MRNKEFNSQTIVDEFNKTNTSDEDKRYLKTVINDAIAIFSSNYADNSPPQSMVNEILDLAKAHDSELYRSSVSALALVLSRGTFSDLSALQGLISIIRNPPDSYSFGKMEMDALLDLVFLQVTKEKESAGRLEALTKLLDAMLDSNYLMAAYEQKRHIEKELKSIYDNTEDAAVKFQAGLARKALEKIGIINEPRRAEWQRRAMAFGAGVESLLKVGSSVTTIVGSFGVNALFLAPDIIKNTRSAISSLAEALSPKNNISDWYSTIREIEPLLMASSMEGGNDDLTVDDLRPLFNRLKEQVEKIPRDIQYAIIENLGKTLMLRSDQQVLEIVFALSLKYYKWTFEDAKHDKKEKKAVRVKILEGLVTLKELKLDDDKINLCDHYTDKMKEINPEAYATCEEIAQENVALKLAKESTAKAINTLDMLVAKAQQCVNDILDGRRREIIVPLIGGDARINAPVEIKQKYVGSKFTARSAAEALALFTSDSFREHLDKVCKAASDLISKQVIGAGAQVYQKVTVDQDTQGIDWDISGGRKNIVSNQQSQEKQVELTLSAGFKSMISESLGQEKKCFFEVKRLAMNALQLKLASSNMKLRQEGKQLFALQEQLESVLKEESLRYDSKISGEDDEVLTITADKAVVDAIADLLCRQGLSKASLFVEQHATLFGQAENFQAPDAVESNITCSMQ